MGVAVTPIMWTAHKEGRRTHHEAYVTSGGYEYGFDAVVEKGSWRVYIRGRLIAKGQATGVSTAKTAVENWLNCLSEHARALLAAR